MAASEAPSWLAMGLFFLGTSALALATILVFVCVKVKQGEAKLAKDILQDMEGIEECFFPPERLQKAPVSSSRRIVPSQQRT